MLVIAHRGSSQQAPENTLPAIQKAIQDQADAVEIDVQLTKDQEIVVIHDEWLNRTTNGSGLVSSHTFSRIRELDAGSWFSPNFSGVRIPHLEEVLLLLKPLSIELNIELKNGIIPYPGLEEKVIRLIQNYQMEKQVILSSFRQDSLVDVSRSPLPFAEVYYV
ncbi:glycerophosphodiester phosphodiesterase family protein [Caldalkalibacillus mannanilyticus]|uniref:glycerophosphodiester phosphodiesterase family protein n=1 Tax=Caldalkalibacillus mannanilyticus TaxID=1418 RepID=UPI000688DE1A|nr:glycerophosphodiester phosphodiesterase family protein [Caldalkalibacillus mannanilyticus]